MFQKKLNMLVFGHREWQLNIDTWKITDAEEMVTNMSEIIDNDGDPFAQSRNVL